MPMPLLFTDEMKNGDIAFGGGDDDSGDNDDNDDDNNDNNDDNDNNDNNDDKMTIR